ncbi:hypothetical protein JTB14_034427 [Gonioctena quinquepunctata]|nr:hypothetical protein JTB14_034427 [Gonioctena quinquepunctata]
MNIQAQYKLPGEFSIYSAEAYAILMALVHIPTGCKNIVICSDSLAVLTSIQQIYNPTAHLNPFVIRIKTSLYNMKISDRNITFIWVKAHTEIPSPNNEGILRLGKTVVHQRKDFDPEEEIDQKLNSDPQPKEEIDHRPNSDPPPKEEIDHRPKSDPELRGGKMEKQTVTTRHGHTVKVPKRLNL